MRQIFWSLIKINIWFAVGKPMIRVITVAA